MQVEIMADGLLKVERSEATFLGIVTNIPRRSFALHSFSSERAGFMHSAGWVVRGNTVSEWVPAGFTEHQERVVIYGPYLEGVTLQETLSREPVEVLSLLERITRAVALLTERRLPVPKLHTRGVVLLNDGGTLFLPGELMQTIREHQPIEDRIRCYEYMNHPDLDPAANMSYFLASMVYRVVAGQYPYHADRLEDIHIRVRAGYSVDPVYHNPRIREDLSDFVIEILRDPAHNLHSPDEWAERLGQWRSEGPFEEVTDQGRALLLRQAEARWKRMTRSFNRKEFIRKHGRATVLIAAMVLIVGTIPGTIISKALAPRSTHGFPPQKVVSTFYNSMNTLDHSTMQDCVIDGAGKNAINEVMNLYVTSRMRMSVEMKSGIVPANSWVKAGEPSLKPASFVFGVSNLKVSTVNSTADSVEIEATYLKWQPEFPQPPEGGGSASGKATSGSGSQAAGQLKSTAYQRKDLLRLKKDRGDWVIYSIDRETNRLLPDRTVVTPMQ
ncbi:hypothetical protein [Salinispira pacifica]